LKPAQLEVIRDQDLLREECKCRRAPTPLRARQTLSKTFHPERILQSRKRRRCRDKTHMLSKELNKQSEKILDLK